MKTYNQIVDELNQIATDHKQINYFGSGELWEVNGDPKNPGVYPQLWMTPVSASLGPQTITYTVRLLCFDLVNKGENNENDVLSDTLQILSDVVRIFRFRASNDDYEEYSIAFDPFMEPFTERFADDVSGWSGTVQIEAGLFSNDCNIPES
jgi:hypothetical protein